MNASSEERSASIQLTALLIAMGGYFVVASQMAAADITALPAYVPLFIVAVVVQVVLLIVGHVLSAIGGDGNESDERDRLIAWRAEARSSWVVGVGVLLGITGLVLEVETVLVAHLLLLSMFASELLKNVLQLLDYRRGV